MGKRYFMVLRTKEDFDKFFKEIYDAGWETGFDDGKADGLSYFLELINKSSAFSDECVRNAEYRLKQRKLRNWHKEQDFYESLKRQGVKEYLEKQEKEKSELETKTE